LIEYQLHEPGESPRRTLTSHMRQAFREKDGCVAKFVTCRMWRVVQSKELWNLADDGVVRVVEYDFD